MLFGARHDILLSYELHITFDNGTVVHKVDSVRYLGLWLDPELNLKPHIDYIIRQTYATLNPLCRSSNCFTVEVRKRRITHLVFPIIDYADIIYHNTHDLYLRPLNVFFNSLCRFIFKYT